MPLPPSGPPEARTIPPGIVLMTIGLIVLVTVILTLLLTPNQIPLSDQLRLATAALVPGAAEYLSGSASRPSGQDTVATTPVLLSVADGAQLPSVASPAEAAAYGSETPLPGQPIRLVIPRLELNAPITPIGLEAITQSGGTYYQWAVPRRFEAGWHQTSALLGQPGNTVLNGHHNVYGEVFRDLNELEVGDEIILYDAAEHHYIYQVTHQELLPETGQPLAKRIENARWIEPTDDERLTLITCWPYTGNSHRLVIVAKPDYQITHSLLR